MVTIRQLVILIAATSIAIQKPGFSIQKPIQKPGFLEKPGFSIQKPGFLEKPGFLAVALADVPATTRSSVRFVPPPVLPERGAPHKRTNSGTRGCSAQSQPPSVTLLVPQKNIGLTTSEHPTFFWYISKTTPIPFKFTLVEGKRGGRTIFEKLFSEGQKSGIMHQEMPEDLPELIPGQEYRWTVAMLCNPDRPDTYVVYQSWIQRASLAAAQASKLQGVTSAQERAQIYAESGFWYDALSELVKAYTVQPGDKSIQEDVLSLLNQVGITAIALQ